MGRPKGSKNKSKLALKQTVQPSVPVMPFINTPTSIVQETIGRAVAWLQYNQYENCYKELEVALQLLKDIIDPIIEVEVPHREGTIINGKLYVGRVRVRQSLANEIIRNCQQYQKHLDGISLDTRHPDINLGHVQ